MRNNQAFVDAQLALDPGYFNRHSEGQHPEFLWIGCSDSRVLPDRITGTEPGDMFVHSNIANLVVQTDMNLPSVRQYAVDVLQVEHVIVCGHYGCGGVKAAMGDADHGLIDNWLSTVKDTQNYYWPQLSVLGEAARFRQMVELNVIEQVNNLGKTHVIQGAWKLGRRPIIHGWVFDPANGLLRRYTGEISGNEAIREVCKFHGAGSGATA